MATRRDSKGRFVKVEDTDTGWSRFLKGLDNLESHPTGSVSVGYFTPEVAQYAAANEFGTKTIPERSFIRSTVDQNQKKYLAKMTAASEKTIDAGIDPASALIPVGNQMRNDIIKKIIDLRSPPNSAETIEAKGSSNPLVDTGQMQRAIQVEAGE
jgi:HK97 gp10 family phage protein